MKLGEITVFSAVKENLGMIRPYLSDIINDNKIQSEQKIYLTIAIDFSSFIDSDETRTMLSKSDNIEIMIGNETNEIIEELLETFLKRYQEGLE